MIAFNARYFAMTNMTNERADILISHVVDGEATAEQWRELEAIAAQEPKLWRELAEAQRDAAALRSALRVAGDLADRISLPASVDAPAERGSYDIRTYRHPNLRLNRFGTWTGWLAAAVIAIIAAVQFNQHGGAGNGGPGNVQPAGLGSNVVKSASDLFNQYIATGQKDGSVLGEVPGPMLVESRPAPSGKGYEVIFVRQVVERAIVPDLYKIEGTNDQGQATLARYRQPIRRTM